MLDITGLISYFFDYDIHKELVTLKSGKLDLDKSELKGYNEYYNRKKRKVRWRQPKK